MSELEWYLQSLQVQALRELEAGGQAIFLDTASAFTPNKKRWMIDQIHASGGGSERFAERVAGDLAGRIASRPQH